MEAITTMRTLLTSLSLAALFTLTTACAVDAEGPDDDTAIDEAGATQDEAGPSQGTRMFDPSVARTDRIKVPAGKSVEDLDEHVDGIGLDDCEYNADCKSNHCDRVHNVCRDLPF